MIGFTLTACPGKLVGEYNSEGARIQIFEEGGTHCYSVQFSFPFNERIGEYTFKVIEYLATHQFVRPNVTREEMAKLIEHAMGEVEVPRNLRAAVKYYAQLEASEYSLLTPLLYDTMLENININGVDTPIYVDHRKYGYNIRTNVVPTSRDAVLRIIGRVYAVTGRPLNEQYPIQDTFILLSNGALLRFATAASSRVARNAPYVSIRIQPPKPVTPTEMITSRTISPLALAYLWQMVEAHRSIAIIGATGSGKTTLLNTLLLLIPYKRLGIAEETPEIRLPPSFENVIQLYTSPMYEYMREMRGSETAIYLIDLVKYLLRARPDIVVIGESRGREIHELIQGILTGHGGATTFHAESPREMFLRLTGEAIGVSPEQLSAFNIIATIKRLEHGRRVIDISEFVWLEMFPEVRPDEEVDIRGERYGLVRVAWWDPKRDEVVVDLGKSLWVKRYGSVEDIRVRAEYLHDLTRLSVFDADEYVSAVKRFKSGLVEVFV